MRISDGRRWAATLVVAAALGACSSRDVRASAGDTVACGRIGAVLAMRCTVDTSSTARGLMVTVRNPDGGFHRLLVTRDGRGLVAADGAVPLRLTVVGHDLIEVTLGGDRYRLPATIRRP